MRCKNCNQIAENDYCSHCGQSTGVSRINFTSLVKDVSTNVFQIDRGFFFTILQLFKRPGHSIREYIQGKRKLYFKPIAYALILSTAYYLASKLVGTQTYISDAIDGFSSAGAGLDSGKNPPLFSWLIDNFAYTMLLLIPVFALGSFIAFLGTKYSYFEHVVLNFYLTGHQMIFYAAMTLLGFLTGKHDLCLWFALSTSIPFAFWTVAQFFKNETKLSIFIRTVFSYIISLVFATFTLLALMGITELF